MLKYWSSTHLVYYFVALLWAFTVIVYFEHSEETIYSDRLDHKINNNVIVTNPLLLSVLQTQHISFVCKAIARFFLRSDVKLSIVLFCCYRIGQLLNNENCFIWKNFIFYENLSYLLWDIFLAY